MATQDAEFAFDEWLDPRTGYIQILILLIVCYLVLLFPLAFVISTITATPLIEVTIILTAIGIVLTTVLLGFLFYSFLTLHDEQSKLLEQQTSWIEAANAPGVIVNNWLVTNNAAIFRLENHGNSFVERLELQSNLRILAESEGAKPPSSRSDQRA